MRGVLDRVIELMAIPLIQGTLRYAYKVGISTNAKEAAEVSWPGTLPMHRLPPDHAIFLPPWRRASSSAPHRELSAASSPPPHRLTQPLCRPGF